MNEFRTTFPAKYGGYCRHCMVDIEPGDLIGYDEHDEINCEQCLRESAAEASVVSAEDAPRTGWNRRT